MTDLKTLSRLALLNDLDRAICNGNSASLRGDPEAVIEAWYAAARRIDRELHRRDNAQDRAERIKNLKAKIPSLPKVRLSISW